MHGIYLHGIPIFMYIYGIYIFMVNSINILVNIWYMYI